MCHTLLFTHGTLHKTVTFIKPWTHNRKRLKYKFWLMGIFENKYGENLKPGAKNMQPYSSRESETKTRSCWKCPGGQALLVRTSDGLTIQTRGRCKGVFWQRAHIKTLSGGGWCTAYGQCVLSRAWGCAELTRKVRFSTSLLSNITMYHWQRLLTQARLMEWRVYIWVK